SYEAVDALIAGAREGPEVVELLREILREIPKEELPKVFQGVQLSFEEQMAIHIRLRRQEIRQRLVKFLKNKLSKGGKDYDPSSRYTFIKSHPFKFGP